MSGTRLDRRDLMAEGLDARLERLGFERQGRWQPGTWTPDGPWEESPFVLWGSEDGRAFASSRADPRGSFVALESMAATGSILVTICPVGTAGGEGRPMSYYRKSFPWSNRRVQWAPADELGAAWRMHRDAVLAMGPLADHRDPLVYAAIERRTARMLYQVIPREIERHLLVAGALVAALGTVALAGLVHPVLVGAIAVAGLVLVALRWHVPWVFVRIGADTPVPSSRHPGCRALLQTHYRAMPAPDGQDHGVM